jgi:hypothetical protein
MRIILAALVLIFSFQSLTKADEISDFQIEGMSVGDSLLELMTEKEILDKTDQFYKSNKYAQLICLSNGLIYDYVQCAYKPDDPNKLIYDVTGVIQFDNKIEECLLKMKDIEIEITNFFKNTKKIDYGTYNHAADKTGKSKATVVAFEFDSGDNVVLYCTNWSEEITKKNYWLDELKISLSKSEFQDFLDNEAYN